MGMGKQAKILSPEQQQRLLAQVQQGRNGHRNAVLVLLSYRAGLRAIEMAQLRWHMVLDPDGTVGTSLELPSSASKGRRTGGRIIPLHPQLQAALIRLAREHADDGPDDLVIRLAKHASVGATRSASIRWLFRRWYRALGLVGCSSHSGRRSFITALARTVNTVGGSIRDVQFVAGHKDLNVTSKYVEIHHDALSRAIDLL